jgi:hypothetical protein
MTIVSSLRLRHGGACAAVVVSALLVAAPGRASTPPSRLLATYEPVTYLDAQERFLPTKVQSFIAASDLEERSAGSWVVVNPDPGPGNLPGPGADTWRLNQQPCTPAAPLGGLGCYQAAWLEDSGGPALYGRLVHTGGKIVLQYWYFYYEDVYSYFYPPSDVIWQAHEGDWEVVNVVLSEDEQPLLLAYSQHCLGERRLWDEIKPVDGTHPVVHVAVGSHANYFDAGTHPIDTHCIPAPVLDFLAGIGLPPPADHAFDGGVIAGPPGLAEAAMPVHKITAAVPAWVGFPGFWGELEYFHAPPPVGTVTFGTSSPPGPAYHPVWSDPLATIATWNDG